MPLNSAHRYTSPRCSTNREALEPVIALLDSEYNRIQALALKAVGAAAKNKTTRRAIYELGALGKLLAYVENEKYHSTHADALASVANILPVRRRRTA